MKKSALIGIAILAGMIVSTSNAQPANAQIADILRNALGGQLPGVANTFNDPYGNGSYNGYDSSLSGSSGGLSGLLNGLLPGQSNANADIYGNQSNFYNTPATGNGIVDSLLPLVQNSGVGSSLLGSYLPQNNLNSGLGNGLFNNSNWGNAQPVVFNGLALDSSIYNGPYRGTPHQVESAMNLDWQMTVLKEQIEIGASQGYLTGSDADMFASELNSLSNQKRQAVRRNGLSYGDSQVLVSRLNDLVGRIRMAWYNSVAFSGSNGYDNNFSRGRRHRGRFSSANAYGQVLPQGNRNEALEKLYLMTRPAAGFRP